MVKKRESYEDLMSKLENIVKTMENGEVALEESMKNYEEGVKVCNKMYKMLNEAEGKIKLLTDDGEKEFTEVDEWYGYEYIKKPGK